MSSIYWPSSSFWYSLSLTTWIKPILQYNINSCISSRMMRSLIQIRFIERSGTHWSTCTYWRFLFIVGPRKLKTLDWYWLYMNPALSHLIDIELIQRSLLSESLAEMSAGQTKYRFQCMSSKELVKGGQAMGMIWYLSGARIVCELWHLLVFIAFVKWFSVFVS